MIFYVSELKSPVPFSFYPVLFIFALGYMVTTYFLTHFSLHFSVTGIFFGLSCNCFLEFFGHLQHFVFIKRFVTNYTTKDVRLRMAEDANWGK